MSKSVTAGALPVPHAGARRQRRFRARVAKLGETRLDLVEIAWLLVPSRSALTAATGRLPDRRNTHHLETSPAGASKVNLKGSPALDRHADVAGRRSRFKSE